MGPRGLGVAGSRPQEPRKAKRQSWRPEAQDRDGKKGQNGNATGQSPRGKDKEKATSRPTAEKGRPNKQTKKRKNEKKWPFLIYFSAIGRSGSKGMVNTIFIYICRVAALSDESTDKYTSTSLAWPFGRKLGFGTGQGSSVWGSPGDPGNSWHGRCASTGAATGKPRLWQ